MISFALSKAYLYVCSGLSSCLNRNFSSSIPSQKQLDTSPITQSPVSCITSGASNTSCNHLKALMSLIIICDACIHALGKHKGNHMSQMHAVTARTSPRVQEKWFSLLVPIKDLVKLSDRSLSNTDAPLSCNGTDRCEKKLPRRSKGCGRCPVSLSNRSSSASSIRRVPKSLMSLS